MLTWLHFRFILQSLQYFEDSRKGDAGVARRPCVPLRVSLLFKPFLWRRVSTESTKIITLLDLASKTLYISQIPFISIICSKWNHLKQLCYCCDIKKKVAVLCFKLNNNFLAMFIHTACNVFAWFSKSHRFQTRDLRSVKVSLRPAHHLEENANHFPSK